MKRPPLPPASGCLCAVALAWTAASIAAQGPTAPTGPAAPRADGSGDVEVRVVTGLADGVALWRGPSEFVARGADTRWQGVAPGPVTVDFPPVPRWGQRGAQLQFDVPAAAEVEVVAEYGPEHGTPAARTPASDDAEGGVLWHEDFDDGWPEGVEARPVASWEVVGGRLLHTPAVGGEGWDDFLWAAGPEGGNYHVSVDCHFDETGDRAGGFGILFRYTGPGDWYRTAMDPAAGTLTLSRSVGGQEFTLQSVQLPGDREHRRLAVQAQGFGVQVFVDHAAVMSLMDGAHDGGRVGLCAVPTTSVWLDNLLVTVPLSQVPTRAIVRTAGRLTIFGVRPQHAGREYWLGMTTPTPPPAVRLLDQDGLPPFLLVAADVPWYGLGRHIHRYTRGMSGRLASDGTYRARIEWPDHPTLRHHPFTITGWTVDATGSAHPW